MHLKSEDASKRARDQGRLYREHPPAISRQFLPYFYLSYKPLLTLTTNTVKMVKLGNLFFWGGGENPITICEHHMKQYRCRLHTTSPAGIQLDTWRFNSADSIAANKSLSGALCSCWKNKSSHHVYGTALLMNAL